MNQIICNLLDFYQRRIGSYDNHSSWEKPLDTIFLKNNFYCLSTKKPNRIEDQIDIDLIKGSSFLKTKSKLSLPCVLISGFIKLIFYPFYFKWWKYHTNLYFAALLLLAYTLQIINLSIFINEMSVLLHENKKLITLAEILTPTIIMLIICIMYTFITSALPICDKKKNSDQSPLKNKAQKSLNRQSILKDFDENQADNELSPKRNFTNAELRKLNKKINIKSAGSSDSLDYPKKREKTTRIQNSPDSPKLIKTLKPNSNDLIKQAYFDENFYYSDDEYDLNENELTDSDFLNDPATPKVKRSQSPEIPNNTQNSQEDYQNEIKSNSISTNSNKEKISCIMWTDNEWYGVDLGLVEISSYIQTNVRKASFSLDYFYIGVLYSFVIGLLPVYFNYVFHAKVSAVEKAVQNAEQLLTEMNSLSKFSFFNLTETMRNNIHMEKFYSKILNSLLFWSNIDSKAIFVISNTILSTIILSFLFFSILTIAERTLNQRYLHAKYFLYLTSHRRAKKHNLPHFRLGKVENIKMWLSLRSFMKRRGPQRSVDAIISSTFLIGVALCSIVCIRFLQDADFLSDNLLNWQLLVWCFCIWTFVLRFMAIGFKTNIKYRNCMSMVITEQINLYLQMEKKPEKKDELIVVNSVLKLAADLLKEIDNPFKISGLGVDPWVYNITKVVILSAFSAVVSELLGFKLKLYKIKIK